MSKKHTLLLIVLCLILGALVWFLVSDMSGEDGPLTAGRIGTTVAPITGEEIIAEIGEEDMATLSATGFVETVPENIVVTEAAVTTVVSEDSVEPVGSFKEYTITAEGGRFSPSEIIVNRGDQLVIEFKAVDAAYDFSFKDSAIGFYIDAAAGESKTFGFETADKERGTYSYGCLDKCGEAESINGLLIIK